MRDRERTKRIFEHDMALLNSLTQNIAGIDEVGRGPLAGPVVAGAVILPKDCDILSYNGNKFEQRY